MACTTAGLAVTYSSRNRPKSATKTTMTYRDVADPNEFVAIATRGDRKVYHRLDQDCNVVCDKLPEIVNVRINRRKDLQNHYSCCSYCHPAIECKVDSTKQPDEKLAYKLMDPNTTTLPGLSD